jgi:hypothetical protein
MPRKKTVQPQPLRTFYENDEPIAAKVVTLKRKGAVR